MAKEFAVPDDGTEGKAEAKHNDSQDGSQEKLQGRIVIVDEVRLQEMKLRQEEIVQQIDVERPCANVLHRATDSSISVEIVGVRSKQREDKHQARVSDQQVMVQLENKGLLTKRTLPHQEEEREEHNKQKGAYSLVGSE